MNDAEKISLLRRCLNVAVASISTLPREALGVDGGIGGGAVRGWKRDALLAKLQKALAETQP